MYSILHETDEATAVNLSVYGKFLPENAKQLVTVASKCMKVYRFNPHAFVDGSRTKTTKLECLLTFTFMAPVRSLSIARVPLYPKCDSLVMSFDDAKLSIVNINPKTMALNTLSLHSIEDEFLRDGYTKEIFSPDLCIDPGQRCAAFLVYGRHLGIVPFSDSKDQHLQSYSVPLRNFDDRLDNIVDMTFLDGYYEPTLLFLYEPIKTTAGRASIRYNTISILGVSINVKDCTHAVVWSFGGLPMTVDRCLQIQLPIGGICLFGTNEIIYLNQSVPPCGAALNSCADDFTKFPLNDYRHLKITLDGCVVQIEGLNNVFVALRSGDLYVLTLDIDPANAVKNLKLNKVFVTSIPYTITPCSPGYVFIGSRLGDSMLLKYTCWTENESTKSITNKKSEKEDVTSDTTKLFLNVDETLNVDEEDAYFYGENFLVFDSKKDIENDDPVTKFDFKLVDRLPNVGPCKIVRHCAVSNVSSVFRQKQKNDLLFNLVSVSGHEKDSSLCFFERSIRPQIMKSSVLNDAVQFWSVGRRIDNSHCYLIIAREMSTLVLELENNMVELESPIFLTSETTVSAGELNNGSISVQVTSMSIILVEGGKQIQIVNIDSNFPVLSASIIDPFISVLTQNGKIRLYRLDSEHNLISIPIMNRLLHEKSPVTSLCIYKDMSGMFQFVTSHCSQNEEIIYSGVSKRNNNVEKEDGASNIVKKEEWMDTDDPQQLDIDDIDEYLFGDEEKRELEKQAEKFRIINNEDVESPLESDVPNPFEIDATYWLFITRETGHLYIYSIPEMQLVYLVKKFNQLPEVLYDDVPSGLEDDLAQQQYQSNMSLGLNLNLNNTNVGASQLIENTTTAKSAQDGSVLLRAEEIVMELQVYGLGTNQSRTVLSALIDDTVIFYEVFPCNDGFSGHLGHLSIRFRRLNCWTVTRNSRFLGLNGRAPVEAARDTERHRPLIYIFEGVGKLSTGFFIAGSYPSILFMDRGEPRLHAMTIDGPIASFATFNNLNYPNGFLYLTKADRTMRIASLQSNINYDASYPFRKILLDKPVHFVTYLLQSCVYGLITSEKQSYAKQCTVVNEDKQFEMFDRDDYFVFPSMNQFKLKLFSTEDWSFVPNTEFEFDEFEVVTCMEEVLLSSESTVSGVQSYLSVGTAFNYGEEVFVRGRVILCEIIDVVPEDGLPTSRHKLKIVYDKEQKGPVTSMCSCNGYLLTGMGQKVFIWHFRDSELHGVSFLDMHFYVHNLVGFRNLAVTCDLYRSLSLIRYQEEFKALSLVSRDLRPTAPPPMAAQFLIDHKQLGFVLSDEAGNVTIFNYSPETKESIGGERLIIRAVINIGSLINSFIRVKGHTRECLIENEYQARETQTCIFATLDGSFGIVRPLMEKVFRRLHMLQQVMTMHVAQPAGLHPRGARSARPAHTDTNQQLSSARNIVDGTLVMQYMHLSTQDKTDLARKLGTSRYQIIDDLVEISRIITHF